MSASVRRIAMTVLFGPVITVIIVGAAVHHYEHGSWWGYIGSWLFFGLIAALSVFDNETRQIRRWGTGPDPALTLKMIFFVVFGVLTFWDQAFAYLDRRWEGSPKQKELGYERPRKGT